MTRTVGEVVVQGRALHCNVCGNATFWQDEVQLPTPFFAFLGGESWSHLAQCAICERCGFIHWFVPPAALARDDAPAADAPDADAAPA